MTEDIVEPFKENLRRVLASNQGSAILSLQRRARHMMSTGQ